MDLPTGNYFKGQSPFLAELYVGPKGPTHKSFQILERWRVDSGQAWVMVSLKTPSKTGGGAPAREVVEASSFGSRPSPYLPGPGSPELIARIYLFCFQWR
jgi:hypothetical protein